MSELADYIHRALCDEDMMRGECERYPRGEGDSHYDFYAAQAVILMTRLEPKIGAANVLPVVRIVLDELG